MKIWKMEEKFIKPKIFIRRALNYCQQTLKHPSNKSTAYF